MYELNGRRVGGGGHPMSRFGDLEFLMDARFQVGNETALFNRVDDLSPRGTNWLSHPSQPTLGLRGKLGAINGRAAFRVFDGDPSQQSPERETMSSPISGPVSLVAVAQWHGSFGSNNTLLDYRPFSTGNGIAINVGTSAEMQLQAIQAGSRSSILGGTVVAEQPTLIIAVCRGADSWVRMNRVEVAQGALAVPTPLSLTGFVVGSSSGGGAIMNGLIGLLGLYRGEISRSRAIDIENFILRDWGV